MFQKILAVVDGRMTECLFTVIKSYFRTLLLLFTQLGQKEGEGQVVGPSLSTVSEFMGKMDFIWEALAPKPTLALLSLTIPL